MGVYSALRLRPNSESVEGENAGVWGMSNFGRFWTSSERRMVERKYSELGADGLAKIMDRSAASIKRMAYDLNVNVLDEKRRYLKNELPSILAAMR